GAALEETHRACRIVTGGGDGQRTEEAMVDGLLDRIEIEARTEQFPQRLVVQQRARILCAEAAEHERGEPAQATLQHRRAVTAEDLLGTEVGPDALQIADRGTKHPCAGRKYG